MKFSAPAQLLLSCACALTLVTSTWAGDRPRAVPVFGHDRPVMLADRDDHRGDDHHGAVFHVDHRGAVWGQGEIWRFRDHDWDDWHRGRWVHDWHGGHLGWWWVVGGAWIFFNAPIYPYPDPYTPPAVIVETVPAAPPPPNTAAVPPAPVYWYYCPTAQNYYPYVAQCPVDWQKVPATQAPPGNTPPGGDSSTW